MVDGDYKVAFYCPGKGYLIGETSVKYIEDLEDPLYAEENGFVTRYDEGMWEMDEESVLEQGLDTPESLVLLSEATQSSLEQEINDYTEADIIHYSTVAERVVEDYLDSLKGPATEQFSLEGALAAAHESCDPEELWCSYRRQETSRSAVDLELPRDQVGVRQRTSET